MKRVATAIFIVALAAVALAQETEKQKKTKEALDKKLKIHVSFTEADLGIVVDHIFGMHGIDLVLDTEACKGLNTTVNVNDVTPAELLKLVLTPHKLDYMIQKDGRVYVSTKEKIAKLKGEGKEKKDSLKTGELLVLLRDGTKVKGKVSIDTWKLETAYGKLTIPASDIKRIWPAGKSKKGTDKKEEGKQPTEDKIETVRFTVTGKLEIDKLEVDTGKGKLAIPVSDIKEILFPGVKPVKPLDEKTLSRIKADFRAIEDAIEIYRSDTGVYPDKLVELMLNRGIRGWSGPYLKKDPLDPWKKFYLFKKLDKGPYPYELETLGADGKPDGEGENKDLSNIDLPKEK